MRNLLNKEIKLGVSGVTWLFLAASLMTLLPGYPILLGSFFVCLGLFQTFLSFRESNDILYTVLLPIRKADAVKAKYLIVLFFEAAAFLIMTVLTVLRMTVLSNVSAYVNNALMNPSPVYLAFVLMIFLLFNVIFVGGFFRTAYKVAVPFFTFIATAMILVIAAEILHHLPGLQFLNTPSGERIGLQLIVLAVSLLVFIFGTLLAERKAEKRLEAIDL